MDGAAQQKIMKLLKIQEKKYIVRDTHSAKTNEGNPRSIYTIAISAFTIFEHLMHNCQLMLFS